MPRSQPNLTSYSDGEYLLDGGGEAAAPRVNRYENISAAASGSLRLIGFCCKRTELISQVAMYCGTTAAGASPTLFRYGLYQRDQSALESYTLVASTPNDITLMGASNTRSPKALSTPFLKQQGLEYLFGLLVVTAAAMPSTLGSFAPTSGAAGAILLSGPIRCAALAGQADLPASFLSSSLAISIQISVCELLP